MPARFFIDRVKKPEPLLVAILSSPNSGARLTTREVVSCNPSPGKKYAVVRMLQFQSFKRPRKEFVIASVMTTLTKWPIMRASPWKFT